jgi:hypothetical protein
MIECQSSVEQNVLLSLSHRAGKYSRPFRPDGILMRSRQPRELTFQHLPANGKSPLHPTPGCLTAAPLKHSSLYNGW